MKTLDYYLSLPYRMEIIPDIAEPGDDADLFEYSGQFKLRMPRSLHRSLSVHAKQEGISMNQYCLYLLTKNDAIHTAHAVVL